MNSNLREITVSVGYDKNGNSLLVPCALQKAKEVVDSGGVAVLLISAAMLGTEEPIMYLPDHDVAFCGGLSISKTSYLYLFQENVYQFIVQTWGGYRRVQIDDGRFEDCMWCVSYGYPE